jgi:4-amino-4-deoxy-L-arabinose transferase-like glycosyltransferase
MPLASRRATFLVLTAIVLWAALLRLWKCDSSLPGLQIDEASNAWNAWCLLKTGQDEWGQRWPVFYTRAYDDYRGPLHLYPLMLAQALGGMSVCTTRLPAAIGGVVTVWLLYYIGRKLFDRTTGIAAAALLAISPWHIQHTRWGHEGCLVPLLVAAALGAMLWAGAPFTDENALPSQRQRPWKWLLAGLIVGLACYGYGSARIYLPVTLLLLSMVTGRSSWRLVRSSGQARLSVAACIFATAITAGPLLWKQLTDPNLNRRASDTAVWSFFASPASAATQMATRYLAHFGPDFLFRTGRTYPALSPPQGYGWLPWYMLPLLVAGAIVLVRRARASRSARTLLVLVAAYPLADTAFGDEFGLLHPLRAFPGVLVFALAGAAGLVALVAWLKVASTRIRLILLGLSGAWMLASHVAFLYTFFGHFNDEPIKFRMRHVDLMQACEWLKPRLGSADAVFVSQSQMTLTQQATLVYLGYDPRDWFAGPREHVAGTLQNPSMVACARVGKIRFLVNEQAAAELDSLARDGQRQRVILILRPTETALAGERLPDAVVQAHGTVWLLMYEFDL